MRSTSSPLAVSMMIGVRSLAERRRRQMDRPSSPGIIKSSTIRSTVSRNKMRLSGFTVFGHHDLKTFLRQVAAQQITNAGIVIYDQNFVGAVACGGHVLPRSNL